MPYVLFGVVMATPVPGPAVAVFTAWLWLSDRSLQQVTPACNTLSETYRCRYAWRWYIGWYRIQWAALR